MSEVDIFLKVNAEWRIITGFVCRACGGPVRSHPQTNDIWGCFTCGYTTAAIYLHFKDVRTRCVHVLGDSGCGYSGTEVDCDKTVEDCKARFNNVERFGGFPHMPPRVERPRGPGEEDRERGPEYEDREEGASDR